MSIRSGIYNWSYQGGNFLVAFRPGGAFYCEKFPAAATWSSTASILSVNWKNFGSYEFPLKNDGNTIVEGYVTNNRTNWRKIEYVRDFNATERVLLGDGYGTVWSFIWEKGAFEIEFRTDGFNHFVCKQYPAHSHWKIVDDVINVNWGQFGEYVLTLNPTTGELSGHKKDQPSNWRRATLIRVLGADSLASVPSHDHAHEHKHGESCNHHGNHGHKHDSKCGEKKGGCDGGDCCDDKQCSNDGKCCDHDH